MSRLRRYRREVARVWRAYTRTPRHRARPAHRAPTGDVRDRIWTGYIHEWAERRRALDAITGSTV